MGLFSDLLKEAANMVLTEVINDTTGFDSKQLREKFEKLFELYSELLPNEEELLTICKGLMLLKSFTDFTYLKPVDGEEDTEVTYSTFMDFYAKAVKMMVSFSAAELIADDTDVFRQKQILGDSYNWAARDAGITLDNLYNAIAPLKDCEELREDMCDATEELIEKVKENGWSYYSELPDNLKELCRYIANYCGYEMGIMSVLSQLSEFLSNGFLKNQMNITGIEMIVKALVSAKEDIISADITEE